MVVTGDKAASKCKVDLRILDVSADLPLHLEIQNPLKKGFFVRTYRGFSLYLAGSDFFSKPYLWARRFSSMGKPYANHP